MYLITAPVVFNLQITLEKPPKTREQLAELLSKIKAQLEVDHVVEDQEIELNVYQHWFIGDVDEISYFDLVENVEICELEQM